MGEFLYPSPLAPIGYGLGQGTHHGRITHELHIFFNIPSPKHGERLLNMGASNNNFQIKPSCKCSDYNLYTLLSEEDLSFLRNHYSRLFTRYHISNSSFVTMYLRPIAIKNIHIILVAGTTTITMSYEKNKNVTRNVYTPKERKKND